MNSLETEYSFLSPTWKLPSVGTTSLYPNTSLTPPRLAPDTSEWSNTMYNSRYVPPNPNRPSYPQTTNQKPGGHSMQSDPSPSQQLNDQYRNNGYSNNNPNHNEQYDTRHNGHSNHQSDNRGLNHHQPVQKRVKIIAHYRQTPSSDHTSERGGHNSYSPEFNQNQNQNQNQSKSNDNRSDSKRGSIQQQHTNNFNIHDYLYGLSAPDPGSYVNAYKNQRRRLEDEKVHRKSVMTDYKTFVQNGGFGPAFGNTNYQSYEEKLDTEKKRKSYSKVVREINQYKTEEHKRIQNNGGQQRNRTHMPPVPNHRPPGGVIRSHFLSAQEVREFERRIKREHDANCKCSLHTNPQHSSA